MLGWCGLVRPVWLVRLVWLLELRMEGWERKACETDSVCWTGEAYCAGGASCTSMVWCELVRLVRLVGLVGPCKTCAACWVGGAL